MIQNFLLCKCLRVRDSFESEALTPSPLSLLKAGMLFPETGERVAVKPGDGAGGRNAELPNTYLALTLTALAIIVPFTQNIIVRADRSARATNSVKQNPFQVGEQLTYSASWSNFMVAGELTLQNKERGIFDGTDGYHLRLQAHSTGIVDSSMRKRFSRSGLKAVRVTATKANRAP
jgi:hypothetical protein